MVRKQSKTHAASWSKPLLKWLGRYNWWECGFLALGALSLTGVIVILFMPIGKGPALMTADGPVPAVSNPAFASFVSEWMALPLDAAPRPQVLENGDAIIAGVLRDIDGARKSVNF